MIRFGTSCEYASLGCVYLHYEAPEDEQNFPMVMEMIRAGEVKENDENFMSPLDILFARLEMRNPNISL